MDQNLSILSKLLSKKLFSPLYHRTDVNTPNRLLCFLKIKFRISCQIVEVCKYDLRMFLAPGAASLPALVRFVGPGVQWQSAARLWGLGVLLLFSLVVGSAHKYQSDQYLPFVSQAKLEVSYAI